MKSSFQDEVRELMKKNRRETDGYEYTVPSPKSYPYQWLWDSCFHAVIYSYIDIEAAKRELESVVARQFENGMLPHMIYWEKVDGMLDIEWGKEDTSTITQPPIIGYAVCKVYEKSGDKKFLEKIYPKLWHYTRYLLNDRDPRGNHLIGIINPDESGEDDSPRFDVPLGLPPKHTLDENFKKRLALVEKNKACNFDAPFCMKNNFWVKDVPFNAIMVEHLYRMQDLADELVRAEDKEYFSEQADKVKHAMREKLLENGVMWPAYSEKYIKMKVATWAIFAPMLGKIYTNSEAEDIVENYLLSNDHFRTPFFLPTVSKSEESFDPDGFWRGPVWIFTNWMVYRGLLEYKMYGVAEQIRNSSMQLINKSGFREHFNPFTGEGQGAHNFTWGGLILDM